MSHSTSTVTSAPPEPGPSALRARLGLTGGWGSWLRARGVYVALIVLGGGLSRAGAALLDPVRHALAARLAWRSAPPVVLSRLGTAAGWIGAAALCYRRLGRDDALAAWTVEVLLDRAAEP